MADSRNISIITVMKDDPDQLWRTCASISLQELRPHRHLVVDGSSPENREYAEKIARFHGSEYYWEAPKGIYKAMDFALSQLGPDDYAWFINSTDCLIGPTSVKTISEYITKRHVSGQDTHWFLSPVVVIDGGTSHTLGLPRDGMNAAQALARGHIGLAHPGMIARVSDLKNSGVFSRIERVSLDLEAALYLSEQLGPPVVFPAPLSLYDQEGQAGTQVIRTYIAKFLSRRRYGGPIFSELKSLALALIRSFARILARTSLFPPLARAARWHIYVHGENNHFCHESESRPWPECCERVLEKPPPL